MSSALDFSRWDGSARLRLERFPDVAREIDLPGSAVLWLDKDDRLVEIFWPDEDRAPGFVRLSVAHDRAEDRAAIWLTGPGREASSETSELEPGVLVHLDDDGCLVGIEVIEATRRLHWRVLEPESAPPDPPPRPERDGHPVFTDATTSEDFTFQASIGSWKEFIADMAGYARVHHLELEASHKRGGLWGLRGVEVHLTVTGPFSAITDFAEYASRRVAMWRDGSLASEGGGGGCGGGCGGGGWL